MSLSSVKSARRGTGIVLGALVLGAVAGPGSAVAVPPPDTTPPDLLITVAPVAGGGAPVNLNGERYFDGNVFVTVKATEGGNESGVAGLSCSVDGGAAGYAPATGAPKTFTQTTTITAEGRRTIRCTATDVAGNTSAASTRRFVIDRTPPVAVATSNQSPVNGGTVSVNIQAADPQVGSGTTLFSGAGVQFLTISIDGGAPFQVNSSNYSTLFTGPGTHTVTYSATDKLGNTSATKSITVTLDTVKPDVSPDSTAPVTVTSPVGDSDAGFTYLTGTASDNRGVTKVTVRFRSAGDSDIGYDQTFQASCPGCGPTNSPVNWSLNLSTLGLAPGSYETIITAYDQAGNTRQARGPIVSVF